MPFRICTSTRKEKEREGRKVKEREGASAERRGRERQGRGRRDRGGERKENTLLISSYNSSTINNHYILLAKVSPGIYQLQISGLKTARSRKTVSSKRQRKRWKTRKNCKGK